MLKNLSKLSGKITHLGPIIEVERENGKKPFTKKMLGLQTTCNQLVFLELRDLSHNVKIGDEISLSYYFSGSVKNERGYNNLIISELNSN